MEVAWNLFKMLDCFVDFSSLQINQDKSLFAVVKLSLEEEVHCFEALGTPIGIVLVRYFDLPLLGARLSMKD